MTDKIKVNTIRLMGIITVILTVVSIVMQSLEPIKMLISGFWMVVVPIYIALFLLSGRISTLIIAGLLYAFWYTHTFKFYIEDYPIPIYVLTIVLVGLMIYYAAKYIDLIKVYYDILTIDDRKDYWNPVTEKKVKKYRRKSKREFIFIPKSVAPDVYEMKERLDQLKKRYEKMCKYVFEGRRTMTYVQRDKDKIDKKTDTPIKRLRGYAHCVAKYDCPLMAKLKNGYWMLVRIEEEYGTFKRFNKLYRYADIYVVKPDGTYIKYTDRKNRKDRKNYKSIVEKIDKEYGLI